MMPVGHRLGLIPSGCFTWNSSDGGAARAAGGAGDADPQPRSRDAGRGAPDRRVEPTAPTTWAGILRRQDVDAEQVAASLPLLGELAAEDRRAIVGELRYDGYLARHRRELERLARLRHLEIPADLEPGEIPGISREVADALRRHRPRTVADASGCPE